MPCSRVGASVSVLCALACSPSLAAQRPIVPLAARWPTHIAVGMRQGQQLWPIAEFGTGLRARASSLIPVLRFAALNGT